MVIQASVVAGLPLIYVLLQLASAGVFHHAGIKVPFFTFFGHDSGLREKDPQFNMILGMGIMAFFCIFIGLYPYPLYQILPYPVNFDPFTTSHVVEVLQLLLFASFAFFLLITSGLYPAEQRKINLDTDWPLRIAAIKLKWVIEGPLVNFATWMDDQVKKISADFTAFGAEKEERLFIGVSVMLALLFLVLYLIVELAYRWIFS